MPCPGEPYYICSPPPCNIYRVRYGIHFLIVRLTFVLFQMSQLRAAKRVCKNPGTKAYYLTKSCNDVARREWLYRDGAARKVLGDRDFVFGDELTRDNLLLKKKVKCGTREILTWGLQIHTGKREDGTGKQVAERIKPWCYLRKQKVITTLPKTLTFFLTQIIFFLCNLGTPNSAAMGCSQPKLSRTGLRNILAFLKVELQHFLGGTRTLLPLPVARGLNNGRYISVVTDNRSR